MQTFSMFFSEDAGEKFSKMDDSQFDDWKKKNPGAAAKADRLRKKAQSASSSTTDTTNKYEKAKKALPGKKALPASGSDLATTRKSEMGKWSQGIKSNPNSDKKSGALTKASPTDIARKAFDVEKVKVKVDGNEGQQGNRPGTTKPKFSDIPKDTKDVSKKKDKKGNAIAKFLRDKLRSAVDDVNKDGVGVSTAEREGGLEHR